MADLLLLRDEVAWFAEHMEMKLRANEHKGGWRRDSVGALLRRLREETAELEKACERLNAPLGVNPRNVLRVILEAADVANFAMMIADNENAELDSVRMELPND